MDPLNNINILFLEAYKALDETCRRSFGSKSGVTEYLIRMENIPSPVKDASPGFRECFSSLSRCRGIRNKLSHQTGSLDWIMCRMEDVQWMKNLTRSLSSHSDPLTAASRLRKKR